MRKPTVKNKYKLTVKDITNLEILDREKLKEKPFWRNNVINAYCVSGSIGNADSRHYGSNNEWWIGIYDKPFYKKYIRVDCTALGGMMGYKFKEFFNPKEIESEMDLQTQEKVLEMVNYMIDNKILGLPKKSE